MATVYTAMKQCSNIAKKVVQPFSVHTFDQQLYAIAQQVKWSIPDEFSSHVIILDGFPALICFIASIGKIWASGGLRDILQILEYMLLIRETRCCLEKSLSLPYVVYL